MKTLIENIKAHENLNGKSDGAVIVGDCYHSCNPALDHGWQAPAIKDNEDGTYTVGAVHWDFAEYVEERGEDPEDAGDYPWDGDCEFEAELKGLTVADDKDEIKGWIGDFT